MTDTSEGRSSLHGDARAAESALEFLRHHDWHDYQCQSELGCQFRAHFEVHRHAVDQCDHGGLDPFGNQIALLCAYCTQAVQRDAELQAHRRQLFGISECCGCGAPVVHGEDIVREVRTI